MENTLGAIFNVQDALLQYQTKQNVLLTENKRQSILISLSNPADFSTHGNFRTDILPLLYFTHTMNQDEISGTYKRYMVQAVPTRIPLPPLDQLHEVCCIRGFPDNPSVISALFGIIMKDLITNINSNTTLIIPIFTSNLTRRKTEPVSIFFDEAFLQIFTPHQPTQTSLRKLLSLETYPIPHATLSWKGQIAMNYSDYTYSSTNNKNLLYNPTSLVIENIIDTMDNTAEILLQYICPSTPISYIIRWYGTLEQPWLSTSDAIILVSQTDDLFPSY